MCLLLGDFLRNTLSVSGQNQIRLADELALAEHRDTEAATAFTQFLAATGERDPISPDQMFRAWVGLAEVALRRGDRPRATRLLEEVSSRRRWAALYDGYCTGAIWLGARERLGGLYRDAGRVDEAAAVDAQVRALRARADRSR